MFSSYKLTIKKEFFFIGLVSSMMMSVVFIAILSTTIYMLTMNEARRNIRSANLQISIYTEATLEGLIGTVKFLADDTDVANFSNHSKEIKQNVLNRYRAITNTNKNIKYCYSGYTNGELVINDYKPIADYDPRTRPWYTSALKKFPELSVGVPYREIKTGEWLLSVSKTLTDKQSKIIGVVSLDCSLEYANSLLNAVKYYNSQTNFVVDSSGTVLVHQNQGFINKNVDSIVPGLSKLFTEESGYIEYTLLEEKRIAFYKKLKSTDWTIVSAIDSSEITTPIHKKITLFVLVLILMATLLGLAQVKLYEKRFVGPLTSLGRRIADITGGKSSPTPTSRFSNYELAAIAKGIEDMTESSLGKKAYELKLILESTSDGIIVLDANYSIMHYNARFLKVWNLDPHLTQAELTSFVLSGMAGVVTPESQHLLKIHELCSSKGNRIDLIHLKNGSVLEQYSCPLVDAGMISGRLWSYRDITDKMIAEETLTLLATTDSLTGLRNRRFFMEQAESAINQAKRNGLPLSLIILDVDYFKAINDTYGHSAGDQVLQFLADSLTSILRTTDTIGRIGGEEFCVLAPNTSSASAFRLAEKIRVFFENNFLLVEGDALRLTVSLGVTTCDDGVHSIDTLMRCADEACYIAKSKGRNVTVVQNPTP
jgi:diguanylate cyclase (GGDEF)-like protein